ncbi:MAG: magnesium/cobalt transporter CorA [Planctomycetota bacterium]
MSDRPGSAQARPHDEPRRRRAKRRRTPAGSSPGTLMVDPAAPRPVLRAICFGPGELHEQVVQRVEELRPLLARWPFVWVNVDGLGDAAVIEELGAVFKLHRLALEDVLNTHQRAKLESYGEHHFLVARMPEPTPTGELGTEQLSIFFGERFLLSFQERPGDCFDPVRKRLRGGKGRLRTAGHDYLAYALLDTIVDAYFPLVEAAGERLDALEDDILAGGAPHLLARIHGIRRELLAARRALWPLREVVAALQREEQGATSPENRIYLRDLYDHVVELLDLVETLREIASGLMELHVSVVNNRMNEVIKWLTILSAVFMPPMLIASIYGMNFHSSASRWNMPELDWTWGYPLALLAMLISAVTMGLWFRRRGWVGRH